MAKLETDNRHHKRVGVNLRAAILLGKGEAHIALTVDMSEGGMLLEGYTGPPLRRGRHVGVNLQGVVSDDHTEHSDHFLMQVVRCHGGCVALRFKDARKAPA